MRRNLAFILSFLLILSSISSIVLALEDEPIQLISIMTTKLMGNGEYIEESNFSEGDTISFIFELDSIYGIDLGQEAISETGILLEKAATGELPAMLVRVPQFQVREVTDQFQDETSGQTYTVIEYQLPVTGLLASGEYHLVQFNTRDNNQNVFMHIDHDNPILSFTVTNSVDTDVTGPNLDSLILSPQSANAGEQEPVVFTITASDENRVTEVGLHLRHVDEMTEIRLNSTDSVLVDGRNVFTVIFETNQYTKPGDYVVDTVYLYDQSSLVNAVRYSNVPPSFVYEENRLFDDRHQTSFSIVNELYAEPAAAPVVTQIELSEPFVYAGDSVDIEVTVDDRGTAIESMWLRIMNYSDGYAGNQIGNLTLNRQSDDVNVFIGTFYLPVNWQSRTCTFGYVIEHIDGMNTQYTAPEDEEHEIPFLNILSVFDGVESTAVLKDTAFDPLQGVSAFNLSEGDMTDRIVVSGSVDTSQVGLYLLRYTISTDRPPVEIENYTPINRSGTYQAIRWIGVNEQLFNEDLETLFEGDVPLVISDQSIPILTDTSEIQIEKDGVLIDNQDELTEEGVYTVTDNSINETGIDEPDAASTGDEGLSVVSQNSFTRTRLSNHEVYLQAPPRLSGLSEDIPLTSMSYGASASATLVIDRSAPGLEGYETSRDQNNDLVVRLNFSDTSAVKQAACLLGTDTLENRAALDAGSGVLISSERTFLAENQQTYLIRAVDLFDRVSYFEITIIESDNQQPGGDIIDDLEYEIFDGMITITNFTGTSQFVDIPDEIDGLPVIAISDRAFYGKGIEYIYTGGSLQSIGTEAFDQNPLSYVFMPSLALTDIGQNAFRATDVLLVEGFSNTLIEQYCQENQITFISLGSYDDDMNYIPPREYETNGMVLFNLDPSSGVYHGRIVEQLIDVLVTTDQLSESYYAYRQSLSTQRMIPNHLTDIAFYFELSVWHERDIEKRVVMTVMFDPEDLPAGIEPFMLRLYRFNETSSEWDLLPNQQLDLEQNRITVTMTGFSEFAILADTSLTPDPVEDESTDQSEDPIDESEDLISETETQTGNTSDQSSRPDENDSESDESEITTPATSTSDPDQETPDDSSVDLDLDVEQDEEEKVDNPKTGVTYSGISVFLVLVFLALCLAAGINIPWSYRRK